MGAEVPNLVDFLPICSESLLFIDGDARFLSEEFGRRNPRAKFINFNLMSNLRSPWARSTSDKAEPLEGTLAAAMLQTSTFSFDCIYISEDAVDRDDWVELFDLCASVLSRSGVMLIKCANPAYWHNLDQQIRGVAIRTDASTTSDHFTLYRSSDEVVRLFRKVGMTSVDQLIKESPNPESEVFFDAVRPALLGLGVDMVEFQRRTLPSRHVWRGSRSQMKHLKVVYTMLNPVGGVSHVRVVEPANAMMSDPTVSTSVIGPTDFPTADAGAAGVFIFHRPLLAGSDGIARVRKLISDGWIIICEFDDHPDYIPVLQRPDIHNFRAVHAVQTTTEPLAVVLRNQNHEIAVFPNEIARLPDIVNFVGDNAVNMLFAGLNREDDWPPYIGALNSVAAWAGARLNFTVVSDRGMFDALQTRHKTFIPTCDYDTYKTLLSRCEISFMPLKDTPFNRCKSDLKFIEAGAHRVVALASPIVYASVIKEGINGLLFEDEDTLQSRLRYLINYPESGLKLADAARQYVASERMLAHHVGNRIAWYRDLWNRREELTYSLLRRVPELA